jgi:hypothetical protein
MGSNEWQRYFERDRKNLEEVMQMPDWAKKIYLPQTLTWCYNSLRYLSKDFTDFPSDELCSFLEKLKRLSEEFQISLE